MDAVLVNPFIEGTLHILDSTSFVEVKPETPFLKTGRDAVIEHIGGAKHVLSLPFRRIKLVIEVCCG